MVKKRLTQITALVAMLTIFSALADERMVSIGRYTRVKATPTPEQTDVLSALTSIHFSETVETVGEAINVLLIGSGYRLESADSVLLENPLPDVHRKLTALPLLTALQTLAGDAWFIEDDRVKRQLAFKPVLNRWIAHSVNDSSERPQYSANSPHQCGRWFTFQRGMLYENLNRAIKQCGYSLGYWSIGNEEYFIDYPVKNDFSLRLFNGIEDVLEMTTQLYAVTGEVNDMTIDISRAMNQ